MAWAAGGAHLCYKQGACPSVSGMCGVARGVGGGWVAYGEMSRCRSPARCAQAGDGGVHVQPQHRPQVEAPGTAGHCLPRGQVGAGVPAHHAPAAQAGLPAKGRHVPLG